jgi:hypothetical protein
MQQPKDSKEKRNISRQSATSAGSQQHQQAVINM